MITQYNKLVRDKIPEILIEKGIDVQTRKLDSVSFPPALKTKLHEETQELTEAFEEWRGHGLFQTSSRKAVVEEMADVLEVIRAIAQHIGVTGTEVENVRVDKFNERGGFHGGVYLVSTEENLIG